MRYNIICNVRSLPEILYFGKAFPCTFIPAKQRARQPCLHAWIFGDCREAQITCSLLRWNFDAQSACCEVFVFVIGCYIICVMKWVEGGSDSSGPIYRVSCVLRLAQNFGSNCCEICTVMQFCYGVSRNCVLK